jgi:hypothetical protein
MASLPLNIIIVEKNATLKSLHVKEFTEDELYKKCGFKKGDDFEKQPSMNVKINSEKYSIEVYAKSNGRAGSENKYDFPPPIDSKLFFGNCAIVAKKQDVLDSGKFKHCNLSLELWEKMYEKLFGGFEDLAATALEDENEMDELDAIPKEKKTKDGYLKDGFVVDSSDTSDVDTGSEEEMEDEDTEENEEEEEEETTEEIVGSELSEDEYETTSSDESVTMV